MFAHGFQQFVVSNSGAVHIVNLHFSFVHHHDRFALNKFIQSELLINPKDLLV